MALRKCLEVTCNWNFSTSYQPAVIFSDNSQHVLIIYQNNMHKCIIMSVTNLNARTATRNTIKSSKKKTTASQWILQHGTWYTNLIYNQDYTQEGIIILLGK